jgi:hypothetical protein
LRQNASGRRWRTGEKERNIEVKRIINRKTYDTATATCVARWSNGSSTRDFQWCAEELYVTKNGAYFLHGEGGPMSAYSRSAGLNSWTRGEDIVPLTREQTINWLERTENTGVLETEFPDAIEQA